MKDADKTKKRALAEVKKHKRQVSVLKSHRQRQAPLEAGSLDENFFRALIDSLEGFLYACNRERIISWSNLAESAPRIKDRE